jgi:uncharacterized protein involved in tolerance to divalent cations
MKSPGKEHETKAETYLKLQDSEVAVIHAASRIFSAYVSSGQVDAQNEKRMILKAVHTAIGIARLSDRLIQSDDEHG